MRKLFGRLTSVTVLVGVIGIAGIASFAMGAESQPIFTLSDPKGDDDGDGTLQYPLRPEMQPGDLDLVASRPPRRRTLFEARSRGPSGAGRPPSTRSEPRSIRSLARFYTFSIDLYIDTDRIPGSGSTQTLPGRRAAIAPANAWEKAVCLTPRPYDAQDMLKAIYVRDAKMELKRRQGSVTSADMEGVSASVAQEVASSVFFPTVVSVTGRSIRFFVPDAFLGGSARDTWSYVVAEAGADVQLKVDIPAIIGSEGKTPGLMIIPILPGKGFDNFGTNREGDDLQPDLIDIIVPPGKTQEVVLKDYDLMGRQPVALPGVVPADVKVK
jgi:hypothetical protein